MKPGSFISKEESKLLQGIAVSLMVFHHLFDFPERIQIPYVSLLNFSFIGIEALIASFGRICVTLFAFNSGYGMRKNVGDLTQYRLLSSYKSMAFRLWNFTQRFWAVFLVFIGLGLIMNVYTWQPMQLLQGFLGRSYAYNAEWWYIGEYIGFLLLFPLLMGGLKLVGRIRFGNWLHGIMLFTLMIATIVLPENFRKMYLICFLCGIFFSSVPIFEWLDTKLSAYPIIYGVLCISILGSVFVFRAKMLGGAYDFIFAPLFVFGFVGLLKCKCLLKILGFILRLPGKYSTYIWLAHTFFGYYLFQKLTFFPKYSPLIFLWCMILSIASGWILESALQHIHKGFRKMKERAKK